MFHESLNLSEGLVEPILSQKRSFYQDRLGTSIGKAEGKRRRFPRCVRTDIRRDLLAAAAVENPSEGKIEGG